MNKDLLINDVYIPALSCTDRYLFLFGGAGSGKSHFGLQKKVLRLQSENGHKFLFARKVKATIEESVFDLTKTLISDEFNTTKSYEVNKTKKSFQYIPNENRIITAGLDDSEKMKSIAGITGILIEEVTELTLEDFLQLDLRLRGETENYKQIVAMFNPVSEDHWLKQLVEPDDVEYEYLREDKRAWRFYKTDTKGNRVYTTVYNTNYDDNEFIDDDYKSVIEAKANLSENYYRVYRLGRWGVADNSNPAWYGFKDHLLSTNAEYNPKINVHCTFDQNLRPYMTQVCFHLEQVEMTKDLTHYRCTVFDEFCTRPPKNRVVDNCKAFKTKYPRSQHKAYLYYYGDASLNIGSTLAKKGVTGFGQIKAAYKSYLRSNDQSNRTQKSNPPIVLRTEFMNMLLAGEEVGGLKIDFVINPRCEELINDLRFQKMGADGKPIKPKVKDKDGVAYEKYGHTSESLTYAIVRAFSRNFQNFIKAK